MSSLFFKRRFRPAASWHAFFGSHLQLLNAFKVRLREYWKLESARLEKSRMGYDKMPTSSLVKKTVLTGAMLAEVEAVADLLNTLRQTNQDALANEILGQYLSDFFTRNDNNSHNEVIRTRNHLVEQFAQDYDLLSFVIQAVKQRQDADAIYSHWKKLSPTERAQLSKLIAINAQIKLINDQSIMVVLADDEELNQQQLQDKDAQQGEAKRAERQQLKQNLENKYAELSQQMTWVPFFNDAHHIFQRSLPNTYQNKNAVVECMLALERMSHIIGPQFIKGDHFAAPLSLANHIAPAVRSLPDTDKGLLNVLAEHRGYNPLVSYNPIFWMINRVRALLGFSRLQWSTGDHHVVQFIRELRISCGLGVGLYEKDEEQKSTQGGGVAHRRAK
jgi:hypothetical protein